jgi:hypothetical protein
MSDLTMKLYIRSLIIFTILHFVGCGGGGGGGDDQNDPNPPTNNLNGNMTGRIF